MDYLCCHFKEFIDLYFYILGKEFSKSIAIANIYKNTVLLLWLFRQFAAVLQSHFLFLLPFESCNTCKLPLFTSMQQHYFTQQILIQYKQIWEPYFCQRPCILRRLHTGSEYIQTQKFADNLIACKCLCTYSIHLNISRRFHTTLRFIFQDF